MSDCRKRFLQSPSRMATMLNTYNFLRCARLALLSIPLLGSLAIGQITNNNDDTSTPIPGAGHDYLHLLSETVNPANGSVSIRINVPTPKGRGLSLPFSFAYDSNGVNHLVGTALGNGNWASDFFAPIQWWLDIWRTFVDLEFLPLQRLQHYNRNHNLRLCHGLHVSRSRRRPARIGYNHHGLQLWLPVPDDCKLRRR